MDNVVSPPAWENAGTDRAMVSKSAKTGIFLFMAIPPAKS
jgi:hypothetical protein